MVAPVPSEPSFELRGLVRRVSAYFRAYFGGVTVDLARIRQGAFEVQLLLSAATIAFAVLTNTFRFFGEAQLRMTVVAVVWGLVHPALYVIARRLWAPAAHLCFLLGAHGFLTYAFTQLDAAWLEASGVRQYYLGCLLFSAFVLLPFRYLVAMLLLAGVPHVLWLERTLDPGHSPRDVAYTALLVPVATAAGLLMLGSYLIERLYERMRSFQRELAAHNDRLEAEVAARAAIIEAQQQQLLQAQKLEAVGTLAAGLAHDFNNLLVPVLGYARELELYAEPGDPVQHAATVIDASARRASDLTQRLLGFAQKGKVHDVPVDLREVSETCLRLVQRSLTDRIRVERDYATARPFLLGDPLQLQQLLVNLVFNARDSMPEGGTLRVRIGEEQVAEPCHADLVPGPHVVLEVSDTGVGIPPEVLPRVFDPFFTTKKQGAGTGLGLAMVYGITRSHRGVVTVRSEVGRGSTFRLVFPSTEARPQAQSNPPGRPREERGVFMVLTDKPVAAEFAQHIRAILSARDQATDAQWRAVRDFLAANASRVEVVSFEQGTRPAPRPLRSEEGG